MAKYTQTFVGRALAKVMNDIQSIPNPDRVIKKIMQELKEVSLKPKESEKEISLCDCVPRVLLVDDVDFNILPLQLMMKENFGVDSDIARDGQQALEMYTEGFQKACKCPIRAYKLIFMDL